MEDMQEIPEDFLVEALEFVEQIGHDLVEPESSPEDLELFNGIFRITHTVKGSSSLLNSDVLTKLAHYIEDVLNKVRYDELKITPDIMDVVLESTDRMKTLLNSIYDNGNDSVIGMDIRPICAKLTAISEGDVSAVASASKEPRVEPKEEVVPAAPGPSVEPNVDVNQLSNSEVEAEIERLLKVRKAEDQARRAQKRKSAIPTTPKPATETSGEKKVPASGGGDGGMDRIICVEVKRLNRLMNLIGELILGKNRLLEIYDDVGERYEGEKFLEELNQVVSQLSIITTGVQLAVMKTRMQPIAKVFSKFPCVVRDLSRKLGKQTKLEITGEEIKFDKSIVEEIGDLIMHVIRNSCDHGVEDPAMRKTNGKSERGMAQLKAYNEGNHIVVEITDDGKGLDAAGFKMKVLEKDLITEKGAE